MDGRNKPARTREREARTMDFAGHPCRPDDPSHERMNFQLLLRRRGIIDHAVLKAMDEVPREEFVEPITRDEAYADAALPIACGQTISQPFVVAYMTEHLRLRPHHRVLEIGTGSGYQAAVLSHLAAEVVTVERFRTLADRARLRLAPACARQCRGADGGWLRSARQPRQPSIASWSPRRWKKCRTISRTGLQGTASLLAPVGPHDGVQVLTRIRRTGDGFAIRRAARGSLRAGAEGHRATAVGKSRECAAPR